MALDGLACTGDPLLDMMLTECGSFELRPTHCETAAEVIQEAASSKPPALLFTSPALGEISPLQGFPGVRICWLCEGPVAEAPGGVEVLSAERLTPELVDAWVRRPGRGNHTARSPLRPPPPRARSEQPQSPKLLAETPSTQAPPPPAESHPSQAPPPLAESHRVQPRPPLELRPPQPPRPRTDPGRAQSPLAPKVSARTPTALPNEGGHPGGGQPRVTLQRRVPKERSPLPIWAALRGAMAPSEPPRADHSQARPTVEPPRKPTRPQPDRPRPRLSVLRQQVVALWGGKPGAGRSTLAIGLSDLLARTAEIRVCTVDLNPYNSSLAALLGKEQEVSSWFHLAEALGHSLPFPVDALRWVRPNWALLSGPDGKPDWVSKLDRQSIAWLVEGLRSQFDYIILDTEARPGPIRETAARLAQLVLVIVSADYPDVLDTARSFEAGLEAGVLDRSRCRLILNRWLDSPHLKASEVADCFSLPVSLSVPLVPEVVLQASGKGIPVTQVEGPTAAAMQEALRTLLGLVAPAVAATMEGPTDLGRQLRGWFVR